MKTKLCTRCQQIKDVSLFSKTKKTKDGLQSQCKLCFKEYRALNKDVIRNTRKLYYQRHRDIEIYNAIEYYYNNQEKSKKYGRAYAKNNRKNINKRIKDYRKNNIQFKLISNLRSRMYRIVQNNLKFLPSINILGCSINSYKKFLEDRFVGSMSWENYGSYWHIDHILQLCYFNLIKLSHQKKAFHYTNTRPLEKIKNLERGDKIDKDTILKAKELGITLPK